MSWARSEITVAQREKLHTTLNVSDGVFDPMHSQHAAGLNKNPYMFNTSGHGKLDHKLPKTFDSWPP